MADNILTQDRDQTNIAIAARESGGVLYPRNHLINAAGTDINPATAEDVALLGTEATLEAARVLLASMAAALSAHDEVAADGHAGMVMLAKRRDSDAAAMVADGDFGYISLDENQRVKVSTQPATYTDITGNITAVQATIGTPVAGGTVEGDVSRASNVMAFCTGTFSTVNCTFEGSLESSGDTNWFTIQAIRSNANTIETTTGNLSAQPVYSWEMSVNALARVRVRCTAHTSGTQAWRFKLGTYATEPIPGAQVSGTQPVSGTVTVTSTRITPNAADGHSTHSHYISAASTNDTLVLTGARAIGLIVATNTNAAARYLKVYNKATAPTSGMKTTPTSPMKSPATVPKAAPSSACGLAPARRAPISAAT